MWKITYGTGVVVTPSSDGLTIDNTQGTAECYFSQSVLINGTYTRVIKVTELVGNVNSYIQGIGTVNALESGANVFTETGDYQSLNFTVSQGAKVKFEYIDLFEGSIAYPHVKEDYAIALTRCRERIVAGNIPCVCYSDTVSLYLLFPNIQMPSKPTISYKQITITANGNKFSSPSATADDVYTNSGAGISVAVNLSKISQTVPALTVLIAEVEAIVISCEPV